MSDSFILDKNSEIIIYGAATMGNIILNRLRQSRSDVVGFIDKRAYEIKSFMGCPVWDMKEIALSESIHDNTIIIISVKNVFQHKIILSELQKYTKCKNYVFLPIDDDTSEESKIMKQVYNELFYGEIKWPYKLKRISKVQVNKFIRIDKPQTIENEVIVKVPVSFVYTNKPKEVHQEWCGINILAYFPHIKLFQYYGNQRGGTPTYYIDFCINASKDMNVKQTEKWKENIIDNRKNIYDEMLLEYELNQNFFVDNAPTAVWNNKGHFNLTSGKHRATFLVSRGARFIPLRIAKEDEEKWVQYEESLKLFNYLQEQDRQYIISPIDNPYFYKYRCTTGDFWKEALRAIISNLAIYCYNQFGSVNFENLTLLNRFTSNRYIIRELYKMGTRVIDKTIDNEYEQLVDRILHCSYKPEKEDDMVVDFALVDENNVDEEIKNATMLCFVSEQEYDMYEKIVTTVVEGKELYLYWINNL